VRHSLETDDLEAAIAARHPRKNELWAAMLLKGCVVNRVDFATEFLMLQKKATV
jgi:hypothetical protein